MPLLAARARVVESAEAAQHVYDYVIVGAGTAGLTLADRLTEDGKRTVLVVEIGSFYDPESPTEPGCSFAVPSVPQASLLNRSTVALVGNCVGGSSAINGMALMRGTARDYDIWAELGGKSSDWAWKDMLPYFKKAIHLREPDPEYAAEFNLTYDPGVWGQFADTRVYSSWSRTLRQSYKVGYAALRKVPGLAFPRDGNGGTHGVFYYPISKDPTTDSRSYSRTGHWDGITRPNYHMIVGMRVNKINLRHKRAVSVQFVPADGSGTAPTTVRAKREVILSAGALRTPQILQLSGIGPKGLLESAGIDVEIDLPGVGANFQDHPIGPSVQFNWTSPLPPSPPPNILNDQGLSAVMGLPLVAPDTFGTLSQKYASQDISKYLPTGTHPTVVKGQKAMQMILASEMRDNKLSFVNYIVSGLPSSQPIAFRIMSRGTVNINVTSPESAPVIDYRALTNPIDLDLMIAYVRFMRWHFTTHFAEYNVTEVAPGAELQTDEQLAQFVVQEYSPTGFHPVGTAAKLPRALGGVVDEELVVYGTENLRVVDASVMPTIVAATTQQTVYAIAEKVSASRRWYGG
ncbi:Oxygen-dependent choline dehydrogenase [Madurella mycetomatis]|uniref:Oxygen-dependent choline dehydrogenase n=1 Tax=Madurella mycetomatis TaxID=100816 RepID=A0A175W3W4_9PEZI|nr:Oxygen-dependent choline dehydrogenase [Madurella mycetomatis]